MVAGSACHSLAHREITPVSASVITWPSPLHVFVSSPLIRALHMGLRVQPVSV